MKSYRLQCSFLVLCEYMDMLESGTQKNIGAIFGPFLLQRSVPSDP